MRMRSTASRTDPLARLTFLLAAGFAALLAAAPAVTLWDETAHALVPWVSPDQNLYLTLSHLRPDAQGFVRNPWYGTTMPASDLPDLRFGLALRAFDAVRTVAGGDAQALVAWHAGIAVVIAAALFWMLGAVTKDTRERPIVLGVIALLMPAVERHVRVVLGGFAIVMGLLRCAGSFVPSMEPVGRYVDGFYTLSCWLPLIAIALEIAARVPAAIVRGAAGLATAVMIAFAILDVRATTAAWRPYNRANGELARAFGMLDLTTDDVVVTPVTRGPASQDASWIPLVRPSTVLYSPRAEVLLPRGSSEGAERLAAYRYLAGDAAAGSLRAGTIPPFLRAARRLIIADYKDDPVFKADRIDRLFAVDRLVRTGSWRITIATVR